MWFQIISTYTPDMTRVSKVWWDTKSYLLSVPYRQKWMRVRGPIGATIAILDDIGWNPISPYKWISETGTTWEIDYTQGYGAIICAIIATVTKIIWRIASQH